MYVLFFWKRDFKYKSLDVLSHNSYNCQQWHELNPATPSYKTPLTEYSGYGTCAAAQWTTNKLCQPSGCWAELLTWVKLSVYDYRCFGPDWKKCTKRKKSTSIFTGHVTCWLLFSKLQSGKVEATGIILSYLAQLEISLRSTRLRKRISVEYNVPRCGRTFTILFCNFI